MIFRDVWAAARISALWLIALSVLALGLLSLSIATADHAAIERAIREAPGQDRGVPLIDRWHLDFREGAFPDCAGLSLLLREASAPSAVAAAIRSETILPEPTSTICRDLQAALTDQDSVAWFTYARYWHGSLLLHRVVLSIGDYALLKGVAGGLMLLSLTWLGWATALRLSWPSAAIVVGTLALLSDVAAVSWVPLQAACFAALLSCAAAFITWGAERDRRGALIAAAIAGGVYNFFDFFCNPECLALLCAWAWAARGAVRGDRRDVVSVALIFAAALGGYGGFWALKWGIATGYAFTGGSLYLFNAGDFGRWTAGGRAEWFPGAPTLTIVWQAFDTWWKCAAGAMLAAVTLVLTQGRTSWGLALPMLVPVALAWLVLEAIAGHTMVHPAITFRAVPISLALIAASLVLVRQTMPADRKPAIAASS